MMILATFDSNIYDKIIAVTLDEYSILPCVDMNWFYNIYNDCVIIMKCLEECKHLPFRIYPTSIRIGFS